MKSIYPIYSLGELVTVEGGKRLPQGEKYAQKITHFGVFQNHSVPDNLQV